jgi:HSP20 family protein
MRLRETLPWNWGKKEVPVQREDSGRRAPLATTGFFDRFDELTRPFAIPTLPTLASLGLADDAGFLPMLDAEESDDEIRITVELPGMDEKDVEVSLRDDVLAIRGEKQEERTRNEDGAQWVERRYGSFSRAIPLPPDVDSDAVRASFKAGVLTVTAPRTGRPEESHRAIPIQVE